MTTHVEHFGHTVVCAALALFLHPGQAAAEGRRAGAAQGGAAIHTLFVDPAGACKGRTPCFTEVQAGIDAAADGDAVVVGPGYYVENVNFRGKDIVVVAERGPRVTVLDGGGAGAVVTFADGEGPSSALVGFTVQNGLSDEGGGITIDRASPTLLANVIAHNRSCRGGGGIGVFFGSPLIAWNRIVKNVQSGCFGTGGGGIGVRSASGPAILANAILANSADDGGGISLSGTRTPVIFNNWIGMNTASSEGGGISLSPASSAAIVQNLVAFNEAARGGGMAVLVTLGPQGLLVNNTLAHNRSPEGSGLYIFGFFTADTTLVNNVVVGAAGQAAISCTDVTGGAPVFKSNDAFSRGGPAYAGTCPDPTGSNGNISADPRFVSVRRRDFRLRLRSPAIDAGDAAPQLPPVDFGGRPRLVGSSIDMGAYESQVPGGGPPSAAGRSRPAEVEALLERARAVYERALGHTGPP